MQGQFLFLGTGGSAGVPMIGCKCDVCTSGSPHNTRLRSSGLIQIEDRKYLIDVGPDFRTQALDYGIDELNGALITHAHADHVAGIDDLRAYYFWTQKKLPCVVSNETLAEIKLRNHYMFRPISPGKSLPAQIDFQELPDDFGTFEVDGLHFKYVSYFQAGVKVTGYRIGNFAYISDIRDYSEQVVETLQGVETLVLSALRHEPNEMHFSVEEAVAFSRSTFAKKTYLTHVSHELDHEGTNATLPPDVRMSYDGLEIPFEV